MQCIDKYRSLSPISHMHKRPEMYIGPTKAQVCNEHWTVNIDTLRFCKKKTHFSPGLERLFIEAMSNAIDNYQRSKKIFNTLY